MYQEKAFEFKLPKLTVIELMVYELIITQASIRCYMQKNEFWYVTGYNDTMFIHYTVCLRNNVCQVKYFFSGTNLPPDFYPDTLLQRLDSPIK